MSQAQLKVTGVPRLLFRPRLWSWLQRGRHRLDTYRPPFRERRFWIVQGFVIFIATMHIIGEALGLIHNLGVPYFLPTSFFLVPVVYAALSFGLAGALATALWATLITIPNWLFFHEGLAKFECMFQILVVNATAFFIGRQVDRQRSAWQQAAATGAALRASEIKYRGLFESSPIAVLIINSDGAILDANPTAGVLFNKMPETLKGRAVADLVGMVTAQQLTDSSQNDQWRPATLAFRLENGADIYLEPRLTQVSNSQGNRAIQVLFWDVTQERQQQAGLREYAAHVLRAQEEERQYVARELHDEPMQQLVLLCRQLDSVAGSDKSLPSSAVDGLREARTMAEEVIKWLRNFTKNLRPPILEDLGMVASIRRLLADFKEQTRIDCQLKVVGDERRFAPDKELGIFRIAQEALRNVERHAKATHVSVTIAFSEYAASLDVLDNGGGFSLPPVPGNFTAISQGGLIGMHERARLLKGKLELQSSAGNGTRVTASIPI